MTGTGFSLLVRKASQERWWRKAMAMRLLIFNGDDVAGARDDRKTPVH